MRHDALGIFPIYRRTADGRHFYRVEAPDRFTELQVVGGRVLCHAVTAAVYPEKVLIAEMLHGGERYLPATEEEWEEVRRRVVP